MSSDQQRLETVLIFRVTLTIRADSWDVSVPNIVTGLEKIIAPGRLLLQGGQARVEGTEIKLVDIYSELGQPPASRDV